MENSYLENQKVNQMPRIGDLHRILKLLQPRVK